MASARQPFILMKILPPPASLTSLLLTDSFLQIQPDLSDSAGAVLAGHTKFPHEDQTLVMYISSKCLQTWLLKIMASVLLWTTRYTIC